MIFNAVILIIGILGLIESLLILIFPDQTRGLLIKIFKEKNVLIQAGVIELILAIILILVGMNA